MPHKTSNGTKLTKTDRDKKTGHGETEGTERVDSPSDVICLHRIDWLSSTLRHTSSLCVHSFL